MCHENDLARYKMIKKGETKLTIRQFRNNIKCITLALRGYSIGIIHLGFLMNHSLFLSYKKKMKRSGISGLVDGHKSQYNMELIITTDQTDLMTNHRSLVGHVKQ